MSQAIKKVLVTANNGQIGFLITKKLAKQNNDFELFSFNRSGLDITSEYDVINKCNEIKPDIIINCGAYTDVDKAEIDIEKSFAINKKGPKYLAEQALKHHALLIHISTDYVFDGKKEEPYSETDLPNPLGIYGKSKLEGEQVIQNSGCKFVILRTAWVFGEHGNNFVKTMLKLSKTRAELGIVGDQFGGPTYAGDISDALISIAKQYQNEMQSGIYHFSGYPYVSWHEFACEIFKSASKNFSNYNEPTIKKIKSTEYLLPAARPANSNLNCNKIKETFAIKQSDWKKALANISQYIV